MDQFISVMGKEGCALLLDCRDLTTKQIPMVHIDDYVFLITNSNAPHKLSSSAYCERRDCCYEAAKMLGKKSLRDADISDILGNEINFYYFSTEFLFYYFIVFILYNYFNTM